MVRARYWGGTGDGTRKVTRVVARGGTGVVTRGGIGVGTGGDPRGGIRLVLWVVLGVVLGLVLRII